MGACCCACLRPKDESEKLSGDSGRENPAYKKDYGSIKPEPVREETPKEDDRLLKSASARPKLPDQPVKREAPIPKENLSLERSVEKHKEKHKKEQKEEHTEEQKEQKQKQKQEHTDKQKEEQTEEHKEEDKKSVKEEVLSPPTTEGTGHVKFAPLPPSSPTPARNTAEEEEKSERSERSERSESDTTPLVSDDRGSSREDLKPKKKGKSKFGVASRVTKTAGKMKKALTKKEKEDVVKKYQTKPSGQGSQSTESGKLERVSSSRMKSKYARERLEKIEKERENKERMQHQTGGFRDPRKAAAERGQRLGELDDATGDMKNQAAGFAYTTQQLAKAMKK